MQSPLEPRRDVWEYGLLPLPALCPFLDTNSLHLAHTRLLARSQPGSNGDRVISTADVEAVLEMTSTQSGVLYEVLSSLSVANGIKTTNMRGSVSALEPSPVGSEQIFVHELVMFLFAQLFSKEAQRADSVECWPESGQGGFSGVEPMSPSRQIGRSVSSNRTNLRQLLQQHLRNQVYQLRGYGDYLRRNLKFILELAQDPATPGAANVGPTAITAHELDRIRFLMLLPPPRQNSVISSMVPAFFTNPTLAVETVLGALKQSWHEETLDSPRFISPSPSLSGNSGNMFGTGGAPSPKVQRGLGLAGSSGQIEDNRVSGVYRGTVVRGQGDFSSSENLYVTDCHEATIYILAPLQTVYISGCSDCTIVVGAAGRMLRVERCDKLQVMAAASRTVISSCHDCSLYLGTPRPPVFIGDNRFIRMAPLNTRYERQLTHVHEANVRLDCANKWDVPMVLVGKERSRSGGLSSSPDSPRAYGSSPPTIKPPFSLLSPDDFLPFVTPFMGSEGVLAGGPAHPHTTRWSTLAASTASTKGPPLYLFPLPSDYERALQRKLSMTADLRQRFKQANLSKDKERELNDAIQAYFKEWLGTTNLLRQIYDLSNLEKEEGHSGAAGPPL